MVPQRGVEPGEAKTILRHHTKPYHITLYHSTPHANSRHQPPPATISHRTPPHNTTQHQIAQHNIKSHNPTSYHTTRYHVVTWPHCYTSLVRLALAHSHANLRTRAYVRACTWQSRPVEWCRRKPGAGAGESKHCSIPPLTTNHQAGGETLIDGGDSRGGAAAGNGQGGPNGKGGGKSKTSRPTDVLDEAVPTLPEPVSINEAVVVANSLVEFAPKQSACGAAFELMERQPTRGALGWIQTATTRTITLRGTTQGHCLEWVVLLRKMGRKKA
jgi:hypothetical protein